MALSDRQLLDALSRTPFVDSTELALVLGEPHTTVHRTLAGLLADGIVGRVSHGTIHLPSSQRYHLTANGIGETARVLGFQTPSDFVRAYPMSREWLTLLIRRMDAVVSVYRLAASMSPGIDGLRSRVEFHRGGRFDATITLHDGRSFGVVRQGLVLRRRSLYDRLRAIAQYDHWRRPDTVLTLVPSVWEERRTARFCISNDVRDCYVAVEARDALERRDLRLWHKYSWVSSTYRTLEDVSSHGSPGGGPRTQSPERKRASLPRPERMAQAAPAFGVSPSEKRTLDLITDHPMIPREHLALWLGVSEGRVSQMMRSPRQHLGPCRAAGQTGRHPLHAVRRGHSLRHPQGPRPASHHAGHMEHRPHHRPPGPQASRGPPHSRRGRRQTKHADGITWFLSKLEAEARDDPDSELLWSVPTSRSDRAYNWGDSAIAPDAVGQMTAEGLRIPFYFEYELRARHPQGVIARLDPYESYYWSPEHKEDQPPYPVILFVVDTEEVEDTYVRTAARMSRMSLPIFVSCRAALSNAGILGRSWRPALGPVVPPPAPVRAPRLPVGLTLPPDASSSCREG